MMCSLYKRVRILYRKSQDLYENFRNIKMFFSRCQHIVSETVGNLPDREGISIYKQAYSRKKAVATT